MNTHPNYELALKLKNASFPQNVPYDELLYGPEVTQEQIALIDHGAPLEVETVIWPSTDAVLNELPCRIKNFKDVEIINDATLEVWKLVAQGNAYKATYVRDIGGLIPELTFTSEDSPKLALINLYLALHGNK